MKELHMVTYALVLVGALNWGLVGLFGFNLVETLLGSWPDLVKLVYILVGIAAIVEAVFHRDICKMCSPDKKK